MARFKNILTMGLVTMCVLLSIVSIQAATLTVNTTADSGAGSLRQAIIDATTNAAANTINFNISTTDSGYNAAESRFTIDLLGSLPDLPLAPLTINNNQSQGITVKGNNSFRILTLVDSAVVVINNLTISNGFSNGGLGGGIFMGDSSTLTLNGSTVSNNSASGNGGGIYMRNSATLFLTNTTISHNIATNGGGIYINNSGTLNINTSTVNGNIANNGGSGGGIFNGTSGTINATSNTIDGNSASDSGGGIFNTATITLTSNTVSSNMAANGGGIYNNFTATLNNNLVALNTAADGNDLLGRGSRGNVFTGTYNLVGNADGSEGFDGTSQLGSTLNPINPQIGTLKNNGGTTFTRELLNGSPAIDKGDSFGLTSDQRGAGRPFNNPNISNAADGADMGAFEAQAAVISYEADVFARPNGDGTVDTNDVTQIRRFSVGLDTPYQSNEFQRADSFPIASKGNGSIDANDVVQARRYSVGFDLVNGALVEAGGPTEPSQLAQMIDENVSTFILSESSFISRAIRIGTLTAERGQSITIPVLVDANGDEAAYGFTLNYDSEKLSKPIVTIGSSGGDVLANTTQAGKIGLSVMNFTGEAITMGMGQVLVNVTFTVNKRTKTTTYLTFTDDLANRSVSAIDPIKLLQQPTYSDGLVRLRIRR